uniref:Uncharacterized protein n=1 Tax=Aegilops tauschii subsp. strangulata TaxID=200361 RepID=A0A453BEU1_AEGTS
MALSDLRLQAGLEFEDKIRKNLGSTVNHLEGTHSKEFFLVAQFSRSKIRLNLDTVGLTLQSCLGGNAARFKVSFLRNWCFKLSVASKDVGFSIYNGGNIANENFSVHFFLWGNGG